jgi:D-alanine-D-alanine ligase
MGKSKKLQVGVLFGGRSGEHEVSLMSAESVLKAIDPEKYEVTQIGITHAGAWLVGENVLEALLANDTARLTSATLLPDTTRNGLFLIRKTGQGETIENLVPLDVIFPVLHGTFGEDGTLQGLLELDGAAYVGAGVLGSAVGMDKGVFYDVMIAQHIPVVETMVVLRSEIENDIHQVMERAEQLSSPAYPLFVKPANLGSSVGITKCHHRSDLVEGLMEAARFDRRVLVQRAVNAREIEVSVLGNDDPLVSVPGEVIPSREFYSYEAKYIDGTSQLLIPAPIPAEAIEKARMLAGRAFKAIDCAGMARVDFLLDKDNGELYLNEINTIPGFTKISM